MARPTRQQRRQRRAQTQPALAGGPAERAVARPAAPSDERGRREERRESGGGAGNFIQESWAELRKVEWPSQQAVVSGTAVVLVACIIVGTYLWLNDELWKYVVQHVLLR